jgi:hypothetical protein
MGARALDGSELQARSSWRPPRSGGRYFVRFEVAQYPTAAMQEQQAGQVFLVCRTAKDSQSQAAARTFDGDILA